MADLYLTRSNRQFAKYANCTAVATSGQVSAWSGVTGVAATDIITVTGSAFLDGYSLTFTSITGGAGLVTGTKYFLVNTSGATFKLARSQGGTAINLTTDITAATVLLQTNDVLVWSSEFRDTFSSQIAASSTAGPNSYAGPGTNTVFTTSSSTWTATTSKESDEVAHEPLRQTMLARTYWLFTITGFANPLPAEVLEGDIISNNAPNTP